MADIKRLNYFTYQFLVQQDFDDEQGYHLQMRRRHNRLLHASGVADGLEVTRAAANQVRIAPGTAVDRNGREIALEDARIYQLVTGGNNVDVFLTIAYQEAFDPADHTTEGGVDEFKRTTERPQIQDSSSAPPADGSVILLARIRLNASGVIESDGAINSDVRTLGSAKIAPKAITTTQLADGAVTLGKLATEVQPLAVQAANAITVVTDNTAKRITVGESHSARNDNPHATTAAQIDAQGGANRIVAQINAGSGVIARARLEPDPILIVSGVVTFQNLPLGVELFSNDIDPGFGAGPVSVQLAIDDVPAANATSSGDTSYGRTLRYRNVVNRANGTFRVFAIRDSGSAGLARIRWHAFRPVAGTDSSVTVDVNVTPPTANLAGNVPLPITASVSNATNTAVTWSITEGGGGTLSAATASSVTYTSPIVSGTYHVVATSVADPSRTKSVEIAVNAAITVVPSRLTADLITGGSVAISADVLNTTNKGITWSVPGGGGSLSPTTGTSTTYTAPAAPGSYIVTATSAADNQKKATCTMNVVAVTISVAPDQNPIDANTTTTVRATITPAFADNRANWQLQGVGTLSTTQGPTTNYTASFVGAIVTVTGTSVADPNKSQSVQITTNNVPGPPGPPGPGKLVVVENVASSALDPSEPAPTPPAAEGKARTFVRPQKRPATKPPKSRDDE